MATNVTFSAEHLTIAQTDNSVINTVTFASIDTISPVVKRWQDDTASVLMSPPDTPPTVTEQWGADILMRNGTHERIELGTVANQATWTNDEAGFNACLAAIYAAIP